MMQRTGELAVCSTSRLRTSLAAMTIENLAHGWQSTNLTCVSSLGWLANTNAAINERKALECKCAYSYFSDSHSREETLGTVTWSTLIRPGEQGAQTDAMGARALRLLTPWFCGALLVQDFEDIFGNLLQLMPGFVTLFSDSIEKDCALVTFMTWRFILKNSSSLWSQFAGVGVHFLLRKHTNHSLSMPACGGGIYLLGNSPPPAPPPLSFQSGTC